MARAPSVKKLIKDLEPHELKEVIVELSKLSKANKQFVQLFLQSSKDANVESVVTEAKKKIDSCLIGRGIYPKVDIRSGRKVVTDYSKVLKMYPAQIAELQLHYVEVGTQIISDYGDMYESIYASFESMFSKFCEHILSHPQYFEHFSVRIDELIKACEDIGWGYGDYIHDLGFELILSMQD